MGYKLFSALLMLLLLVSCKKSDVETPLDTIIATINGKTTTFTSAAGSYGYSSVINNYDLNLSSIIYYPKIIGVRLTNPTPIEAGTYDNVGRTYPVTLYIFYDTFISNPTKKSIVTITSISSTNVKGTFSGDLSSGADSITITNGSFNINF